MSGSIKLSDDEKQEMIEDANHRQDWLAGRMSALAHRGSYLAQQGKTFVVKHDEAAEVLAKLTKCLVATKRISSRMVR